MTTTMTTTTTTTTQNHQPPPTNQKEKEDFSFLAVCDDVSVITRVLSCLLFKMPGSHQKHVRASERASERIARAIFVFLGASL